jgi:hypothetical protein
MSVADIPIDSCSICLEEIDLEKKSIDGMPVCVICDNGHRIHYLCFVTLRNSAYNIVCPICRIEMLQPRLCYTNLKGYAYTYRKGGKRRKTKKTKKQKKRKSKKRI